MAGAPGFATVSFYKLFGFPTGVGGLLARHDALRKLRRPWFAGGTFSTAHPPTSASKTAARAASSRS